MHHNAFKAHPHVLNKSCASLGQWQRTGTSAGGLGGCGAGGVKGSLVTHRQLSQSGPTGPTASSTGGQLLGSNLPLNAGPAGAINLAAIACSISLQKPVVEPTDPPAIAHQYTVQYYSNRAHFCLI